MTNIPIIISQSLKQQSKNRRKWMTCILGISESYLNHLLIFGRKPRKEKTKTNVFVADKICILFSALPHESSKFKVLQILRSLNLAYSYNYFFFFFPLAMDTLWCIPICLDSIMQQWVWFKTRFYWWDNIK